MNTKWKDLSSFEKFLTIIMVLCAISFIVFLVLRHGGIYQLPSYFDYAILGLFSLCETFIEWRRRKNIAIMSLICAIIFAALVCLDIFM